MGEAGGAGLAQVAHVDRVTDQGAGQQFYARMPDGYLVECGTGYGAEKRAMRIVEAVNAAVGST